MTIGSDQVAAIVAAEWCAVLDVSAARDDDGFFDLGGNSLLALAFLDAIEERLSIKLPLEALFVDGTLGAVIAACDKAQGVAR